MKECYQEINCLDKHRDEFSIYGEAVAARIRKLNNPVAVCILKNKIDNAIFQAEMEEYQKKSTMSTPTFSSSGEDENCATHLGENSFGYLELL